LIRCVLIVLFIGLIGPAQSATIRVAKDGSGDYLIIQEAVDAAASGDTVLVGPGRYNEGQVVSTPGWTEFVRVLVHHAELTIIGSGADQTIIGPVEDYNRSAQGRDRGVYVGRWFGCDRVRVDGIGFENMWGGVAGAVAGDVFVSRCRFEGNETGVLFAGSSDLSVSDSEFQRVGAPWGILLYTNSADNVIVRRCTFTQADELDGPTGLAQFDGTLDVTIDACVFVGGTLGVTFYGAEGSIGRLANCSIAGQTLNGLGVNGQTVDVVSCEFEGQSRAVYAFSPYWPLNITDTVFRNVTNYTFGIDYVGELNVHGCVLAHGPEYTFFQLECLNKADGELGHLDLAGNDWGTTDADSIASWIYSCDYIVDYIPFIGQQVATEKQSIGGLKALFLGR